MNNNVAGFNQISRERILAERAKAIAQEIDPKAGDFFRRSMERAARMGMRFIEEENKE